jgi:hypothetical protein
MSPAAKSPRISVNKLAEYLEATPTRRKQIVHDAKYPAAFITTRYKDARELIKSYIQGNVGEDDVLAGIDAFNSTVATSDWQEQDNALSAELLELLLDTDISPWKELVISPYEGENTLLNIAGVGISINPDLIVKIEDDQSTRIGLMKLHISKTNELSEESQKVVAALLYEFAVQIVIDKTDGEEADPGCCISFDLFKQCSETCPSAFKMRMRKIEAACEEIALWWDKL